MKNYIRKLFLLAIVLLVVIPVTLLSAGTDVLQKVQESGKKMNDASREIERSENLLRDIQTEIEKRRSKKEETSRTLFDIEKETKFIREELKELHREIEDAKESLTTAPRTKPVKQRQIKRAETGTRRNYRVRPGDTLSGISLMLYGNSAQWKRIYEANRSNLTSPSSVRVGQILSIPEMNN